MSQTNINNINNGLNTSDGRKVKQVFQSDLVGALQDHENNISTINSDLNTSNTGIKARITTLESQIADENKVRIFDKISDAQSYTGFEEGDRVQVLGYYSKNDGAGHERVYSLTDDGSGVSVLSGGFLNYIKKNGITYSSNFGLTGLIDQSQIFTKLLNYTQTVFLDTDIICSGNIFSLVNKKIKLIIKSNNKTILWNSVQNDVFIDIDSILGFEFDGFVLNNKNDNTGTGIGTAFKLNFVFDPAINYQKMTMNSMINCKVEGFDGMFDKIFDISGTAHCDQTLIENCKFSFYKNLINCTNKESVMWTFNRCDFYAFHNLATHFIFDELQNGFMVQNSTFSCMLGETLFKSKSDLNLVNGTAKYIFDNVRIESFERAGQTEIVVGDIKYGSFLIKDSFFNGGSATNKIQRFNLQKNGNIECDNCVLETVKVYGDKYLETDYITSFIKIKNSYLKDYFLYSNDGIELVENTSKIYNAIFENIKFLTYGNFNTSNRQYNFSYLGNDDCISVEQKCEFRLNKKNKIIEIAKYSNITDIRIKKINIKNATNLIYVGFLTKNNSTNIENIVKTVTGSTTKILGNLDIISNLNKSITQKEYSNRYNLTLVLYDSSYNLLDLDFEAIVEITSNGNLKTLSTGITYEIYN